MLNSETKRHIDAARDVLVGVAPNPTTQIDQITYALIYKFMDDMDQAAIKAGGNPSFFTRDLEPYAWSKISNSRMGNQEKMNLYSEALTKFSESKQLPELFRVIFKAAFLPYRSPETLGLFLKEISYFDYSHPEELGNAYEYLLSIMSSQGDAGQFRTPRHIIDFIVEVLNPTKDDKVLDPSCGTAGFLVSTYNHILKQHDGKDDPKKKEKPLTPDERKKLMQNLQGFDIDPTMVRIAQVNMYLHQFKNPQIFQYDTLTSEERWNEKFDVILANPPFMTPKGGIKPHNKFSLPSNRAEVLFVDYIINHLRPKGRAGIIVPEGIIFQGGNTYKALRKNLVENGLYAVVSLPGGVFQPYSNVKTSILFFDNELAKHKSEIAFIKISADGYDLGATKREVSQNDLPLGLESLKEWTNGRKVENSIFTLVSKDEISEKGVYKLSGDHYNKSIDYSNLKWPRVKLNSFCNLVRGVTFSKNDEVFENGQGVLTASNLKIDGTIDLRDLKLISNEIVFKDSQKLKANDLFICLASGSDSHIGKVAYIHNDLGLNFGGFMGAIRVEGSAINSKFLYYQLRDLRFNQYLKLAISGSNIRNLSAEILGEYEIPLPPVEIQEKIVAELDGYAGIISGAKQIVENWKPKIEISPDWSLLKLSDICDLITKGTTPTSVGFDFLDSGINFVKVESITRTGQFIPSKFAHISSECHKSLKRSQLQEGDVLFSIAGALGRTAVVTKEILPANTNQALAILRVKTDVEVHPQFIEYMLVSDLAREQSAKSQTGVAQQNISLGQLGEYSLPIPSFKLQTELIEQVKKEKELVTGAILLAEQFEARTQTVIAKLWSQ
jgi:type I restriction enzyme M protein